VRLPPFYEMEWIVMTGLALGLFVGAYLNNPQLRQTVDTAVKKAVGLGIDTLNGKGAAISAPPETSEDE